jgi:hypothetical protein
MGQPPTDNSTTTIQLSSTTNNENLLPGQVIPDGQGGVLASWTISPSNPPVPQFPYQVADVVSGAVGTPFNLPFSPQTVVYGQYPTLVLGDSGAGFATNGTDTANGPIVTSFNPTSGSVNWNYQAGTQSTLSFVAATAGAGVAITDSQNGVIQLNNGTPTQISSSLGTVQTSLDASWYLQTSQPVSKLYLSPLVLAQSYWAFPHGSQFPMGAAMDMVQTDQPQGTTKQLPPSGATLNTNYNSIEILTTEPPSYIFQNYLQTFFGAWPGINGVATVPISTNITGIGQNLTFTLTGIANFEPLVWVGLGQGPFSVQTERFDATADTISVVTLKGHPLAGWRYWRVYSVGTNDIVIETGAADTSAPGPLNYLGYRILKKPQIKIWQEYLQFILRNLHGNADPNATQGSNPVYNNVTGVWNPNSPSLSTILYNVCQASSCN